MGYKDRKQLKFKQRVKRRKKRLKLTKKGEDPDKYYHGNIYVGHARQQEE
jgi:hypothetical protein